MSEQSATSRCEQVVAQHYGRARVEDAVLAALGRESATPDYLMARDLAPLDHFHTRGEAATLELAQLIQVEASHRILDVGGGLGGAARFLASQYGCHVTVLELTAEYVRLGEQLTERTGLNGRVSFRVGSGLELPFDDGSFDCVITQHVSMNIANKERLYAEIGRVLRPGGSLGLHEIVAGPVQPIHFPVPWARELEYSFLRSQSELRRLIRSVGFDEQVWIDETGRARRWFVDRLAAGVGSAPTSRGIGVHLLMGDDFEAMFRNQVRNLSENRAEVVLGAMRKAERML